MHSHLNILLQAAGDGGSFGSIFMIVALIAIFYFMMIRPQQKRQKQIKQFRESMKVGDTVVTAGGIYGKIRKMGDTDLTLEIADGVDIRIDKASVFASPQQPQQK